VYGRDGVFIYLNYICIVCLLCLEGGWGVEVVRILVGELCWVGYWYWSWGGGLVVVRVVFR